MPLVPTKHAVSAEDVTAAQLQWFVAYRRVDQAHATLIFEAFLAQPKPLVLGIISWRGPVDLEDDDVRCIVVGVEGDGGRRPGLGDVERSDLDGRFAGPASSSPVSCSLSGFESSYSHCDRLDAELSGSHLLQDLLTSLVPVDAEIILIAVTLAVVIAVGGGFEVTTCTRSTA